MVKFKSLFKGSFPAPVQNHIITDNEQLVKFLRDNPTYYKEVEYVEISATANLHYYCSVLEVEENVIKGKSRVADIARKRHAIINQLLDDGLNKSEVARLLNLDHTSVIYARQFDETRKSWDYLYEPLRVKLKQASESQLHKGEHEGISEAVPQTEDN